MTPRNLATPATLVAGTAVWLVPVRAHEAGAVSTVGWLAAGLLALAAATLLVPGARRVAGEHSSTALEGALVALAGAISAAAGVALFAGTAGRSLPAEAARDIALAMAATAPLGLLLTVRDRAIAADPATDDATPAVSLELELAPASPVTPVKGTTRRNLLKVGGGAVATAAIIRMPAAASAAPRRHFVLTVTEGDIHMVDDVPVFCRTFGGQDGTPQIPGPALGNPGPFDSGPEILEGSQVSVSITNLTARDHTFLIERTGNEAPTDPVVGPVTIPAGGIPVEIIFDAPQAGTYIYRDANRNNRLLGMHGVMVVMPPDGSNRPYAPAPGRLDIPAEFLAQYTWMLHDLDPLLGELARSQPTVSKLDYPFEKFTPRYFTINGKSGVFSTENLVTVPVFPVQDDTSAQIGALIRVVNTGAASHSPHWHGNHVFLVERDGTPTAAGFVRERDIIQSVPLSRISVLLPVHTGLDAWPPLDASKGFVEQAYPMHCHAEMSQTAAGGLYPMGMLTDWRLVAKPQAVAAARARLASGAHTRQAKAQIARVIRNR